LARRLADVMVAMFSVVQFVEGCIHNMHKEVAGLSVEAETKASPVKYITPLLAAAYRVNSQL